MYVFRIVCSGGTIATYYVYAIYIIVFFFYLCGHKFLYVDPLTRVLYSRSMWYFFNLYHLLYSVQLHIFLNTAVCPQGWSVYNRKCFFWIEDNAYTASEAKTLCSNLMPGGPVYLAKPDSIDEETFILSLIRWDG